MTGGPPRMTRISSPRWRSIEAGPIWSGDSGSIAMRPYAISRRMTSWVRIMIALHAGDQAPNPVAHLWRAYAPPFIECEGLYAPGAAMEPTDVGGALTSYGKF